MISNVISKASFPVQHQSSPVTFSKTRFEESKKRAHLGITICGGRDLRSAAGAPRPADDLENSAVVLVGRWSRC